MASLHDLDALAGRIRAGIAKSRCCIVDRRDLEILWSKEDIELDEEKVLIVKNFAAHYGFTVDLSPGMVFGAFQNPI